MPEKSHPLDLTAILSAMALPEQPQALFQAVQDLCQARYGFYLFTILQNLPETDEVLRVYSSNQADYPLGGRKPMGATPWGDIVLKAGQAWLGNSEEDIRWAFPDAALILKLNCEASACAPIRWKGQTLGVISLNAAKDTYSSADLAELDLIAQLTVPAFLTQS